MLKKASVLVISCLCLSIFLFAGCMKKVELEPTPVPVTPTPTIEPTATPEPNKYYDSYNAKDTRPIAVMIDNDGASSRPHAGLEDAALIYEVSVEGGATRLMPVFRNVETEKIGPVRSARHYFIDYMKEFDSLYVHFGWSPLAGSEITNTGVEKINGILSGDAGCFWREEKYAGDYHSAYTSIKNIKKYAGDRSFKLTSNIEMPIKMKGNFAEIKGEPATKITLAYAGFYTAGYTYNPETKTYTRLINNQPHPTQSKEKLEATNIIILEVKSYPLGDGSDRIQVDTKGSGNGYYITGGVKQPIKWTKADRRAQTKYLDSEGNEIALNPGQTWIQIIPSESILKIQ